MKFFKFMIVFFIACIVSACSSVNQNQISQQQQDTDIVQFDEVTFLEEIKPNVECLNSCEIEMFQADVDFDDEYYGVYESEQQYDDGRGKVVLLYKPENEEEVSDYFLDPVMSSYYTVKNFKTNEDVKNNLEKYLADNIIDELFHDDFLEYNGNLYLRRGARGYGAITCDVDSLKFIEEKDNKYYVSMDYLYFNDYDYTARLEFQNIDGNWILTDILKEQQ